ncbi:MAG: FAD-dependent oxidoreductase [Chthoniobacterales bacterium]|nr:FAD-dependent oxidoreductase [Chthoniobacterales bacterium]
MKFTLSATKQEANDTFSFIFAPEQPLQWKAGQLLRYVLNHPNPDDRGVERFFSIASAPHEKHVMLTTRFAPKSSSFKKALKNLRPGDAIEAHDLEGDFVVDDSETTFVFIAGGIGITPFRAIFARPGLQQETAKRAASLRKWWQRFSVSKRTGCIKRAAPRVQNRLCR